MNRDTITQAATSIGVRPLVALIVVGSVGVLIGDKLILGRIGPTLALLAIGIPACIGLGHLTGTAMVHSGDIRWVFAGIGLITFTTVAATVATAMASAARDDGHHPDNASDDTAAGHRVGIEIGSHHRTAA
ncbi:hypothetical protein ABN028_24725 [Actinopolymorpha sp. B17G11]|uniref:hypothetical protein n=1 Tax=Actinopolymorpha sp. B17G11 TaxID=3160861 RepID=UPI0032E480E7